MFRTVILALGFAGVVGCTDAPAEKTAEASASRFAAVKKSNQPDKQTTSTFCEVQFPGGEAGRRFATPPERPVPGVAAKKTSANGWRWVNLWATWCHPCVEEMGLLTKWRDSLSKDGIAISMDMWSVDEDEAKLSAYVKKNNMPGEVHWLKESGALGPLLQNLGVAADSPIPVHALIDPAGNVRCARVGAVHEEDYGAIKAFLSRG